MGGDLEKGGIWRCLNCCFDVLFLLFVFGVWDLGLFIDEFELKGEVMV